MNRLVAALAALLLLTGCGLPLPRGVQSAGQVRTEQQEPVAIRVIPPGPQPGATPEDVVRGFLRAQASPEDDYAVARQFLAPGTGWNHEQDTVIYRSRRFLPDTDGDPHTFTVSFDTAARISAAGSFSLHEDVQTPTYEVERMPSGEFRLTSVPPGTYLRAQDRDRSFRPSDVYFLARGLDGRAAPRLVPDRVFLPVTADRAQALVESLLAGASLALRPAVETAVPLKTGLASPVIVADGVVTVDLTREVLQLDARELQQMSAQLAWTLLPTFSGLRLLVEGAPLDVPGVGAVQTLEDWAEFDPAGIAATAPLYFVQDRTLRTLDALLPVNEVTEPGRLPVDQVAVSPVQSSLGLLTRSAGGDQVRIAPLEGPFGPPVLEAADLRSLSWGPGEQGLWVLESGPAPVVHLLPGPGTTLQQPLVVSYSRPPGAGPLAALRVSRDGARVALVFGSGTARRLYVGRVEPSGGHVRIAGVVPVAPELEDVTDVAWQSGTTLAVLASSGASQVVAWNVVIDGSVRPLAVQRPGLPGDALAIAAAPGRPLVVSAMRDGRPRLFRDNGTLFRLLEEQGTAPTYPG